MYSHSHFWELLKSELSQGGYLRQASSGKLSWECCRSVEDSICFEEVIESKDSNGEKVPVSPPQHSKVVVEATPKPPTSQHELCDKHNQGIGDSVYHQCAEFHDTCSDTNSSCQVVRTVYFEIWKVLGLVSTRA